MKKQLSLAIVFLLVGTQLSGQVYKASKEKLYQSLIGKVHILSIFVDTYEDVWEDDEKEYFLEELNKSESWLVDQASEYDVELEFENDYFFENGTTVYVDSLTRRQGMSYKIKKVMEELGFDSFDDYLEDSKFDLKENKLKLLFFVKSKARSHAYNRFSNISIDLAIIYCNSTIGMITDNYVISHELLHQFGAWDLYYGRSQTLETAKEAKELYPNSIMIVTAYNKHNLEVDDLTAWRVGWHNDYKEEYVQFDSNRRAKHKVRKRGKRGKSIQFDLKRKRKKKD